MSSKTPGILILLLVILFLVALLIAAIAGIDPKAGPGAAATPSSEPAQQTNETTPTPTPALPAAAPQESETATTPLGDLLLWMQSVQDRFTKWVQAFLPLLLGLLALGLLLYTVAETLEYRIEFDKLQNGTGDASFGEAMGGMDGLIREKLLSNIQILLETIKQYASLTSEGAEFPPQKSLPQDGNITGSLDNVLAALGDNSPKYLKPLLSLWRYILPGRGSRIRMTFQHDGSPGSHVGLTFEFIDLGSQKITKVFTVWEEDPLETEVWPWVLCMPEKAPQDNAEGSEPTDDASEENDRISWSLRAARALKRASLYEDAISYYEKTLAENETDRATVAELVACQNKLAARAGPAAAFETAARLEESELLEAAAESYAAVFKSEPQISFAHQQWRIALGLGEGLKGVAFDQLAAAYLKELDLYEQAIGLYKRAVQEGSLASIGTLWRLQQTQADALVQASRYLLQNEQWVAADTYLAKALANVPDHRDAIRLQEQLKASQPPQENKEALAALEVGNVYLQRGDPASAKNYFVKALEKQPDYKGAQEALGEALEEAQSLRARFTTLLDNAMVWLAVELFRQETDRKKTDDFRKAQYHNFYGAYLMSLYESYPSAGDLAEADLREAIQRFPRWLLPYEYLGDLYALRGMNEAEEELARRNLVKAIACYDTALTKEVFHSRTHLSQIPETIKHQILIERHTAELLTCPKDGVSGLWEYVRKVERHIQLGKQSFGEIPVSRDFEQLYFSLAVLYGLVSFRSQKTGDDCACPHPEEAKPRSSFYLACAGCVETDRIAEAEYSSVMREVFTEKEIDELLNQIEIVQFQHEAGQAKVEERKKPLSWQDVLRVLEKAGLTIPKDLLKEA